MKSSLELKYCNVDKLFFIYSNGEQIHSQKTHPTEEEINEAVISDNWHQVFNDMKTKRVRVSDRIYYTMLEVVPPINFKLGSFYCGECYSDNLYYFFETINGKRLGSLKPIQ